MKIFRKLCLFIAFVFVVMPADAQESEKGWYLGVHGGAPFGVSDFSSFGSDRTGVGVSGGVYGGYIFNDVLSLEAMAKWGRVLMYERDCCEMEHYWLGEDGVRYNSPVLDMNGWDFGDLKSSVAMQQYGLRLNVNVLGLFDSTKGGRWTAEVSPVLAAVGTEADIRTSADNSVIMTGDSRWHLGIGGDLQAGYKMTENLLLGVYTGVTYLTGKAMDGMPEGLHSANYVWESGLRVGWMF